MKNKGFTLIELLLALGISSIAVGLIFAFFLFAFKSYKNINTSSELQFQAQYILNFMADKIINSKSISLIKEDDITNYSMTASRNADTEFAVKKISFIYGDNVGDNYVFHIVNSNIRYGNGDKNINPTVELGNYVDEMYISLLRDGSFHESRAVKIKIVMNKGGRSFEAFQTSYIRNY